MTAKHPILIAVYINLYFNNDFVWSSYGSNTKKY